MPRVQIPVTEVTVAGVAPPAQVTGDATEKHFLALGRGDIILEAENVGSTVTRDVTIETPGTVDGIAVAEQVVSVPKETKRYIAIDSEQFRQKEGKVFIDPAHAELKFRAFRAA